MGDNGSPYAGIPREEWARRTEELLAAHPLRRDELVEIVLTCWESTFASRIGTRGYRIGTHVFPKPQIMGFLLHELIALDLADRYPTEWRVDRTGRDKDLVYVPDASLSVEIKTSSHRSQVFGNRSYAQPSPASKKAKSGYYLAVNFEKFTPHRASPSVVRVRFGWLDHSDWIAQKAATGQQARLAPGVYETKIIQIFFKGAKS